MELLVSKNNQKSNSIIKIGSNSKGNKPVSIGDGGLSIIAGPCTIESYDQLMTAAHGVAKAGANLLRAGAYKPRTSPYSFQGLEHEGLELLSKVKSETGLATVSEIIDHEDLPYFEDVDLLQVGAKNMQNYSLLKALGRQSKPVLLKRGWSNTLEELLLSAEYIVSEGNPNVILCERGIRTFETGTRNSFDINAIPMLKKMTHLPVIADPSHGTGMSDLVKPVSMAAVAAGADGLMIEVHNDPKAALCDGFQSITVSQFTALITGARQYEKIRSFY